MTGHDQPVAAIEWDRPGAWQVAAGIWRIPLAMPQDGLRAVNVYAVESANGLMMIDAGWRVPGTLQALSRGLASGGHELGDISDVFVTHIHRDHYTLGPELRRRYRTRVHLGAGERPGLGELQELRSNVPVEGLVQLRRADAADLAMEILRATEATPWHEGDWEDPDEWLEPGAVRLSGRRLDAVATPGHTKGHLVFHDVDAGLLFAGDHVLPSITPSIGFELGTWDLPLGRYLASLAGLLQRPDADLLPAHGAPGARVHDRARQLMKHHNGRLEQSLDRVADLGWTSGVRVAELLPWTRRNRAYASLDPFNRMLAVSETMAHLDVLVAGGQLAVERQGAVDHFAVC